jgi:hypothetical protein
MLGLILNLKYVDHDITNENKFLEVVPSNYFNMYVSVDTSMVVIEP